MYYRTYIDKDTTIVKNSLSNFGNDEFLRLFVTNEGVFSRVLLEFDETKLKELYNNCEFSLETVKHELVLKPYREDRINDINHISEFTICWAEIPQQWNGGCGDSACEERCWDYVNPRCNQSTDSANWFFAQDNVSWDTFGIFDNAVIASGYTNSLVTGNCLDISGDTYAQTSGCTSYFKECVKSEIQCDNYFCSGVTVLDCGDFICPFSGCSGSVCCVEYKTTPFIDNNYSFYGGCVKGNCNDKFVKIDLTNYVNDLIAGKKVNNGIIISFSYEYEMNTPMQTQMLAFYSSNTESFYKPYLESSDVNPIEDDRDIFYAGKDCSLYLFTNVKGNPIKLDEPPAVEIYDNSDNLYLTAQSECVGLGVYKISLNVSMDYIDYCAMWVDKWKNIKYNGKNRPDVIQQFEIKIDSDYFQFGNVVSIPAKYAIHTRGVNKEEIIQKGEIRKVFLDIMQDYSRDLVVIDDIYYKIYCKAGREEFLIHNWYPMNRSGLNNWFYLDTNILLPQVYYIDFKTLSAGETKSYGTPIKFTIIDKKDLTSVNMGN